MSLNVTQYYVCKYVLSIFNIKLMIKKKYYKFNEFINKLHLSKKLNKYNIISM